MTSINKYILINSVIMLVYQLALYFWMNATGGSEFQLGFLIFSAFALALHAALLLILVVVFAVKGNHEQMKAALLSLAVIGIAGFSSCFGLASI